MTPFPFEYDGNNRLTNMVDAVGRTTYSYTDFGAILSEDGPFDLDTVSYAYTASGLRSQLTLTQPDASTWVQTYGYDLGGRLTDITSQAGLFRYAYDTNRAAQWNLLYLPTGGRITNSLDTLGRLTCTKLLDNQGNILNSHSYEYDNAGRRTRQTRADGSYVDYGYDKTGQLISAAGKESGGAVSRLHEQLGYAYDPAGNLQYRTNNALVQTFSVDNLNALTNVGRSGTMTVAGGFQGSPNSVTVNGQAASIYADKSYAKAGFTLSDGTNTFTAVAQDASGRGDTNVASVCLPASVSMVYDGNGNTTNNGTRVFDYDDENQLIRVTEPGAWRSDFVYDGKMRRRERWECVWAGGRWVTNLLVRYVYDGMLVIQERHFNPQLSTLNPQVTVTYTRGNDLRGTLQKAGGIGGLLARTEHTAINAQPSTGHAYYHADGNGNITALIATNHLFLARYLYEPFGAIIAMSGPLAQANLYRSSSKEYHPSSDLVYYLCRFYAPNFQRWLTRDPLGEVGGMNLCSPRGNNPLSIYDPYGLSWAEIGAVVGGIVGGVDALGLSIIVDFGTVGVNIAATPAEVAAGIAAGTLIGGTIGTVLDNPSIIIETIESVFDPTIPTVVAKNNFPPGFWDAESGAAEWGRKHGDGVRDGKCRFHGLKQKLHGKNDADWGVNPDTGDVCDEDGKIVGDLDTQPPK